MSGPVTYNYEVCRERSPDGRRECIQDKNVEHSHPWVAARTASVSGDPRTEAGKRLYEDVFGGTGGRAIILAIEAEARQQGAAEERARLLAVTHGTRCYYGQRGGDSLCVTHDSDWSPGDAKCALMQMLDAATVSPDVPS